MSIHAKAFITKVLTCWRDGFDADVIPISVTQMGIPNLWWADWTYSLKFSKSFQEPYLENDHEQEKKNGDAREYDGPVQHDEVDIAILLLDLAQELAHPILIPGNGRAT